MNLLTYLKKLRNKLTGNDVYLVSSEKIGFKPEQELIETTNIKQELTDEEELELLETATKNFFPKSGVWYSSCFNRSKEHTYIYLPCNLRDYEWLAHTMQKYEKLNNISYHKILDFVKTSKLFETERYNYEQRIVAWQIDYMIRGGEGWIASEEFGGDFIFMSPNVDIGFRKGIKDTLMAIGMDPEAIEEGIEKNANLWRNKVMSSAFSNRFDDFFLDLDPIDKEHKELWLKIRKYEYYLEHKESVDLYSPRDYSSDNMYSPTVKELTEAEKNYEELKTLLEEMNQKRLKHIQECKNDPSKKRIIKLF